MSCKVPMKNGINCGDQWVRANSLVDTTASVKLAGEEAKDRLYEPKHKKKLVRVLTVIAYVFFVSLAAIMLSLYYMFLWNGNQKALPRYAVPESSLKCDNVVAEMQQQVTTLEDLHLFSTPTPEENITWKNDERSEEEFRKTSTFFKKLMYNKYPYSEND